MKDSLTTLEFPKIQRELASYCKGERAKDTVSSLAPYQNKHFLLDELKRLEEGMLLYEQYGSLPLSPSLNLSSFLLLAKKGGSLKGEVLVAILQDIHQGKDIVHFLKGKEQNFPYLNEKCSFFLPFTNLERLLTKSLKEDGSLKDEASTRLSSLPLCSVLQDL